MRRVNGRPGMNFHGRMFRLGCVAGRGSNRHSANTATHIRRMFLFIRTFRWFDSWLIQLSMVPQSYKFFNAELFFLSWISNGRQADTGRPPGETCSHTYHLYQKDSTYTLFT